MEQLEEAKRSSGDLAILLELSLDLKGEEDKEVTSLYEQCVNGNYADVLKNPLITGLLNISEDSSDHTKHYIEKTFQERQKELLLIGISALQGFIQANWTGPGIEINLQPINLNLLTINGEQIYAKTLHPQLLWLARFIFVDNFTLLTNCLTVKWWAIRALRVHQKLLNELSQCIYDTSCKIIDLGMDFDSLTLEESCISNFKINYMVELAHFYLTYQKTSLALDIINKVQEMTGIDITLSGAMGKRTKFQQTDIAQLVVKIEKTSLETELESPKHLPKDVLLNDEVYLDKTKLTENVEMTKLSAIEQSIVLVLLKYVRLTSPVDDELVIEEMKTYVQCVLDQPRDWSLHVDALLVRSTFETKRMRTLDRSMTQIQEIVDHLPKPQPSNLERLKMFYSSNLPPRWEIEKRLGSVLIQLGCVKNALEIFIRLELWDDVIACYHCLERRNKAEEIVREQMKTSEDPILYCQLGDCTDDPDHYIKAWEMSNHRCTRAQRSLGHLYFKQKKYKECVEPYQHSLRLNPLQLVVCCRLGFAAMTTEQWEIAAKAYRNAVNIDSDNFEAWNNLSNVYIQMKKKSQAWRTLQEALKCNFHNWRIWENYMLVSIDCGAFSEAMIAFHRILDEQDKYIDEAVLRILCRAITTEMPDNTGQPADKLRDRALKLFGRLTSKIVSNALVWKLYADLYKMDETPTQELKEKILQYRQKAQRLSQQKTGWEKDTDSTKEVLMYSIDLVQACVRFDAEIKMRMATKLMVNTVLTLIRQYTEKTGFEYSDEVISLQEELTQTCAELTN